MMVEKDNIALLKREGYRLSERALESDASALDASDQRAMGFCAVVVAGAAVLIGLTDSDDPDVGLLLSGLILALSAGFAGYSARPRDFYFPGARFDDLEEDYESGKAYLEVIDQMGRFNDKHSRHNRKILLENSRHMTISYVLALAGLAVALLFQLRSLL